MSLTEAGLISGPYAERMIADSIPAGTRFSRQGEATGRLRLATPFRSGPRISHRFSRAGNRAIRG
ncbi:MAG: hypothetical protein H6896_12735 [Rhodovulum sp.]|nr:hypothetical protein [Rhodovulum sp.]